MSVLNRLAHSLGRRDEVPNQELARELAAKKNKAGIKEIAENLWNKDKNIQADCIKVLYEVGVIDAIKKAKETGSVITVDNAISTLAYTAAANDKYNAVIFPYLLNHLSNCRPKEVPQHSEKTLPAMNASNKADFIKVLEKRMEDLSGGGLARVKKVIKLAETR
jgi:3-dehydroquinate dehydratase